MEVERAVLGGHTDVVARRKKAAAHAALIAPTQRLIEILQKSLDATPKNDRKTRWKLEQEIWKTQRLLDTCCNVTNLNTRMPK